MQDSDESSPQSDSSNESDPDFVSQKIDRQQTLFQVFTKINRTKRSSGMSTLRDLDVKLSNLWDDEMQTSRSPDLDNEEVQAQVPKPRELDSETDENDDEEKPSTKTNQVCVSITCNGRSMRGKLFISKRCQHSRRSRQLGHNNLKESVMYGGVPRGRRGGRKKIDMYC